MVKAKPPTPPRKSMKMQNLSVHRTEMIYCWNFEPPRGCSKQNCRASRHRYTAPIEAAPVAALAAPPFNGAVVSRINLTRSLKLDPIQLCPESGHRIFIFCFVRKLDIHDFFSKSFSFIFRRKNVVEKVPLRNIVFSGLEIYGSARRSEQVRLGPKALTSPALAAEHTPRTVKRCTII